MFSPRLPKNLALLAVLAALPVLLFVRVVARVSSWVLPRSVMAAASRYIPVSIRGGLHTGPAPAGIKSMRVAVIGGGIAGCGAAYALKRAGAHVELFEAREALGGNAKTWTWHLRDHDVVASDASGAHADSRPVPMRRAGSESKSAESPGTDSGLRQRKRSSRGRNAPSTDGSAPASTSVTTGLSVLAWPREYFHNYRALLDTLGIKTTSVKLPFFIHNLVSTDSNKSRALSSETLHAQDDADVRPALSELLANDFQRWDRMVAVVRMFTIVFDMQWIPCCRRGAVGKSFYRASMLNPFSFISLRMLSRAFGVSSAFWNQVVVPVYSSTFLTTHLDAVPAIIAPVMVDVIPLRGSANLDTWLHDSREVFERLTHGCTVRLSCPVTSVGVADDGVVVHDGTTGIAHKFDRVIFACPSMSAEEALPGMSLVERVLLRGVLYADEEDKSLAEGIIHSDPRILGAEHGPRILSKYANYIHVRNPINGKPRWENTFVVSSWCPAVKALRQEVEDPESTPPMLVTYNVDDSRRHLIDRELVKGSVNNARAHPHLTTLNLLISTTLMKLIQGRRGMYFCASYTTPGNGHDLSLLSGFAVANAIGAPYPLAGHPDATSDFVLLRKRMGL